MAYPSGTDDPVRRIADAPLAGRVVLVTGAGAGLGAAMAIGVAAAGACAVLVDVDAPGLAAVERRIAGEGGVVLAIRADVSDDRACAAATTRAIERFGRVDVLVNNAALGQGSVAPDFIANPARAWEVPEGAWRRMFDVNVHGLFCMTRRLLPPMLAGGWGRIVNVTTNLDSMLRTGFAPYGPTKAANEALTAVLAAELAGSGVTANVLIPGGPADTAMVPADQVRDRRGLVAPTAMVAPLVWLASAQGDRCNGRRLVAATWAQDETGPDGAALSPAGWPQLAGTDRAVPMAGAA